MHRIVVLYPPPLDRDAFATYYRGSHLPLAQRLPGVVEMSYALDLDADGGPYYALFQATFATSEDAAAAMASAAGAAVHADVANYATGGAVVIGGAFTTVESDAPPSALGA